MVAAQRARKNWPKREVLYADEVEGNGGPDGDGAPADPDHGEAREVEDDEGHDADEVDPVGLVAHLFSAVWAVVGIDPLGERRGDAAEEARARCGRRLWHKGFEISERSADGIGKPRFMEIGLYIPN